MNKIRSLVAPFASASIPALILLSALLGFGSNASAQVPDPVELPDPVALPDPVGQVDPAALPGQPPPLQPNPASPPLREMRPPEGEVYTWKDGDRTRKAWLQADLVVAAKKDAPASGVVIAQTGSGVVYQASAATAGAGQGQGQGQGGDAGQPVFRDSSGSLMTLPGGVLLMLDAAWTEDQAHAFLAANGIARERVSPLGELPSAYVVETAPGFPSLELANRMADLAGVQLSSPNWWTEIVTK